MIRQPIASADKVPVEEDSMRVIEYFLAIVAIVTAGILALVR
jgi:hypothetical protein